MRAKVEPAMINAISKSMAKAAKCETHFAAYYLTPGSVVRRVDTPLARTGSDVHRFMAAYVTHLVETQERRDPRWAAWWLERNGVTAEARRLVLYELRDYQVDPELSYGTELFLSAADAGDRLQAVEQECGAQPGRGPKLAGAMCYGTLDHLYIDGAEAMVEDYKSGWATTLVSDFETYLYSALVFAHFPAIQTVKYRWLFVRLGLEKDIAYARADLKWILPAIRNELAVARDIAARKERGGELTVNPFSGLCVYCQVDCPLRQSVATLAPGVPARVLLPPVQGAADARRVAGLLYAADLVARAAREALKPYLNETGGVLPLADDYVVELAGGVTRKYPLREALEVLGIELRGETSPAWDVPLDSLYISSAALNGFASAKKRAGMADALAAIAREAARTSLKVRRLREGETPLLAPEEELVVA